MKHPELRLSWMLLVGAVAFVTSQTARANPIVPVTLGFEREGLDLDTGTIVPIDPMAPITGAVGPQFDLMLAYNTDRSVHGVVFHNGRNGVQIAFLEKVGFNLVDSTDLARLSFTTALVDKPFETGDSIVVRTDTGTHYLLGNAIEDSNGVTFDTQLLDETTAGLVRPAAGAIRTAQGNVPTPVLPAGLSAGDWRGIRALLDETPYRFDSNSHETGSFIAGNTIHSLRAELDRSGFRLSSSSGDDWDWSLALTAYGYGGELRRAEPGTITTTGNRLEHRRGSLIEWYVNDCSGLEQGFTLESPPTGERSGPLSLTFASSGSLVPAAEGDSGVRLLDDDGKTVLRYAGLLAWDATGRELRARLHTRADRLTIEVHDSGAVYPVTIDPTVVNEDVKITASDAGAGDDFGYSVAVAGDTAIVGAYQDDDEGSRAGSAYVFVRNGASWNEQAKLTASDVAAGDLFGITVAISGDTALVGAAGGGGLSPGAAYVFVRSGTAWVEQAKLVAGDAATDDFFGHGLALSGDTALVGASGDDDAGTDSGSALFTRTGTTWSEQAKIAPSDPVAGGRFGWNNIGLSGDTALVGSWVTSGGAYVFVRNGANWNQQAKLTPSGGGGSFFALSLTLNSNTALVGAFFDDDAGSNAGAAYVFVRSGTSWSEQAKLTASDGAAGDFLGFSVALFGDQALIGSYADKDAGSFSGSAYLFERTGTTWSEQVKLTASDGEPFDFFGWTVALSAGAAFVGANGNDDAGSQSGSVYVFQFNEPPVAACEDAIVFAGPDCAADASIDAGSFDPDGGPVTLSQDPPGPYGSGDTLVTLTVTDERGTLDSCTATVTVVDETPPSLTVSLDPDTLWPPNHRMIDIEAAVTASDNCGSPTVLLDSLTSNEADDAQGGGDGRTQGDTQFGSDDFHFRLRAERAGGGSGRIYTAVYTATDGSGNAASEAGLVVVPHDQGGLVDPVAITLDQNGAGTLISWDVVAEAESYNVIRGKLDDVTETGVVIDLGNVVCIEAGSLDESTFGQEDHADPTSGRVFFYLVDYDDGISVTYGTESAGMPRAPGSGDCL